MIYELGIVGAGNMAEAIARGVLRTGLLAPHQLIAADIAPVRRDLFTTQLGVLAVDDPREVAKQCRTLLLSVKPQQAAAALTQLGEVLGADTCVISIMAGLSSAFIAKHLGGHGRWRVVRTMPNTPMLVGEGIVGISAGQYATAADLSTTRRLFESAADVIEVTEPQLDAVTAVSGSGPAYFFYFVEQMIRAGESLGLSAEQSKQLAVKTAVGAARMLADSADSPQELRRKVTSPGGTTQAAITHLETNHVGDLFSAAIVAAARRSKELGV